MAVKLIEAPGHKRIKSQQELDRIFETVTAAARKKRSAEARHALEVYNKVVADGRFVKEFATDPGGAAQNLGLKLSPLQIEQIQEAGRVSGGGGVAADTVELVAVAIIVLVLAGVPESEIVIDSTGMIKV